MKVTLYTYQYIIYITILIFCMACNGDSSSFNPISTSLYVEGDTIITEDQELNFNYCYPGTLIGNSFSLADNMGKVFMIEMSATW